MHSRTERTFKIIKVNDSYFRVRAAAPWAALGVNLLHQVLRKIHLLHVSQRFMVLRDQELMRAGMGAAAQRYRHIVIAGYFGSGWRADGHIDTWGNLIARPDFQLDAMGQLRRQRRRRR